jgi:hypothetical protein
MRVRMLPADPGPETARERPTVFVLAFLSSAGFMVGSTIFVLAGVVRLIFAADPCQASLACAGSGLLVLAEQSEVLLLLAPLTYLLAGLLDPPRPYLTGLALAGVHLCVLGLATLPTEDAGALSLVTSQIPWIALVLAMVVVGVMVTGLTGALASRLFD